MLTGDKRFKPLGVIVKLWAKQNGLNDAPRKILSNYTLALMLINYLQCGCNPPVLPCLRTEIPNQSSNSFSSANTQSLGDLLIGFLEHYSADSNFDRIISVKLGDKLAYSWPQNPLIFVEDPYTGYNTARNVGIQAYQRILTTFRESNSNLVRTRDLQSILPYMTIT